MDRGDRYRGPDRRPPLSDGTDARSWSGAGLGLLGLAIIVGLLAVDTGLREALLPFTSHLQVAALVLTVVFAAASTGLWRVTGEVRGCRIATAAWALAGVVALDLVGPTPGSAPWLLQAAFGASSAAWLLWAAVGPDVDTQARAGRDLLSAALATLALWGVLLALVWLPVPGQGWVPVVRILAVTWWVVVAINVAVRSAGARAYLPGWTQWAVAGIAAAEVVRFIESVGDLALAFPSSTVRFGALALAAGGTVTTLATFATSRRAELHHALLRQQRGEEDQRSEAAERDHEFRNALMAIEGATLTLQRHGEELSPEVQEQLTATVVNQLAELRGMMLRDHAPAASPGGPAGDASGSRASDGRGVTSAGPGDHGTPVLHLADVVREQVGLARARDLSVELRLASLITSEIRSDRSAISRVVDNLLRNAEVHGSGARGGRIDIEVRNEGDQVVLSVRDHGPGVPIGEEESIFQRGVRLSPSSAGEGLGLHIARRTMRDLGGDLRHEHPTGGGARFVATFPSATAGGGG